jgi:hypothetical protein
LVERGCGAALSSKRRSDKRDSMSAATRRRNPFGTVYQSAQLDLPYPATECERRPQNFPKLERECCYERFQQRKRPLDEGQPRLAYDVTAMLCLPPVDGAAAIPVVRNNRSK